MQNALDPKIVQLLEQRAIKRRKAVEENIARELEAEASDALRDASNDEDEALGVTEGGKGGKGGGGGTELPPRLRDVPEKYRKVKGLWGLLTSGQVYIYIYIYIYI